jgi:hypothetical protein
LTGCSDSGSQECLVAKSMIERYHVKSVCPNTRNLISH